MLFVSLIRGLVFYVVLLALGTGLGWLVLPWRYDMSVGSPHMMMAMIGGGVTLILAVVVVLSFATTNIH